MLAPCMRTGWTLFKLTKITARILGTNQSTVTDIIIVWLDLIAIVAL